MTSLFDVLKPKEEQRAIQKAQANQPAALYLHITMGTCKCGVESLQYQELLVAFTGSTEQRLAVGIKVPDNLPRIKSISYRNVDGCESCFVATHKREPLDKGKEPNYEELKEKYSSPRIKQFLEGVEL